MQLQTLRTILHLYPTAWYFSICKSINMGQAHYPSSTALRGGSDAREGGLVLLTLTSTTDIFAWSPLWEVLFSVLARWHGINYHIFIQNLWETGIVNTNNMHKYVLQNYILCCGIKHSEKLSAYANVFLVMQRHCFCFCLVESVGE